MTSRERMLAVLEGRVPDRLPVTTHHVMPWFLEKYLEGVSPMEFFQRFNLDPVTWVSPWTADKKKGHYDLKEKSQHNFLADNCLCSDSWRIEVEEITGLKYYTEKYKIFTPSGELGMVLQSDSMTTWVTERLIKEKKEIELLAQFAPVPVCDRSAIDRSLALSPGESLVRCAVPGFGIYGQPGCWQDAAVLFGVEKLIVETFLDPVWVRDFLSILQSRKYISLSSLQNTRLDLLELGGGDASTTVISPDIFRQFVAPFDASLIEAAHEVNQKIVYHTCGGMMPILEDIADMKPDAVETFTPIGMGGDADLAVAKAKIGEKVCMIGGFDQFHFFQGCDPETTRKEVRRCFTEAGPNGGYILAPSDHFFDAELKLIKAFAEEAAQCYY